ncbi:MAG: elongation factor 4 [Deltaproteobacteria bacterium]|nr:elongation factor 4 [Deltaproteobacteria bacterium]MBW2416799.1 elongation factor 4 [Deltaproteobacteria bacterium]
MGPENIRNFAIIAHIDHGKSTLADRLLERTGTLDERTSVAQFLDKMDLERERGITIKAQTVRMEYTAADGQKYVLNLIDTPGHVDFHYEVSRSLAACEGALLVVDAAQGVEAQTVANAELAVAAGLEVIPVLNKIDLPNADPERVLREIEDVVGIPADDALRVSAKTGEGIDDVLEAIVEHIPAPRGAAEAPLQALIFDSWYDSYQGATVLARVMSGELRSGQRVKLMATGDEYDVAVLGVLVPDVKPVERVACGEVAVLTASIRDPKAVRIGDTLTDARAPAEEPLPGFRPLQPMVWSGLYPSDPADYDPLRSAIEKLQLNDSSFSAEPETSEALGFGFRCGYLGLLHMEIAQERLEREYGLNLIITAPTVVYRVERSDGTEVELHRPSDMPPAGEVKRILEPRILAQLHTPPEHLGAVIGLCQERRGVQRDLAVYGDSRAVVRYDLPLAEVVIDFYDRLKSSTRGYASMDYEMIGFRADNLVKVDVLVNGDPVDALSVIVHADHAYERGLALIRRMKQQIPRQMFEVAIQASIGAKVVARVTVKALRKNVTAKCYGGDITRKKKLLEKQKEGKRRMKRVGSVDIPQAAFLAVLGGSDGDR